MAAGQPAGQKANVTTVEELASTPVVAVRPGLSAMAALQEMYRRGVHHLAVVSDDGAVGLVRAVDLLYGIAARDPRETPQAGQHCRTPAPALEVGEDVRVAAQCMIAQHTDALLVMSGGAVRGVLTAVDLVRTVAGGVPPEAERQAP